MVPANFYTRLKIGMLSPKTLRIQNLPGATFLTNPISGFLTGARWAVIKNSNSKTGENK